MKRHTTIIRRWSRTLAACCLALLLVAVFAPLAEACPTCKSSLEKHGGNLAGGFYYSILFMLAMPMSIAGGLGGYFYYLIRKARIEQAATNPESAPADVPPSRI